ncbi:MAG: hypothetical protein ACE5DN_00820 [Flavobacteriales bacterium]
MRELHDFILVGSGPSGSMAAQTLVENGADVLMLDGGFFSDKSYSLIPEKSFEDIRQHEEEQYRYLLGDSFEGLPLGELGTGAQLTPSRQFITERTDELLPLHSETFSPMQSLARGGLGSGWGAGCCVFSADELRLAGMDPTSMHEAYNTIASRIGISGERDDSSNYTIAALDNILPPQNIDNNAQMLLSEYGRKKAKLNALGFHLGKPGLALLTEKMGNRHETKYHNMDFYSDKRKSVWRPWMTIDELSGADNFSYRGGSLVLRFSEAGKQVEVTYLDLESNSIKKVRCRKLILACGALNTARVVLASYNDRSTSLPLLCNPYYYVVCLQAGLMGKISRAERTSLAQLSIFYDPDGGNRDVSMASVYSYSSMMMFRLLNRLPVNMRDGRKLLQFIMPGMLIAGIHHPDMPSVDKFVKLGLKSQNGREVLKTTFRLSHSESCKVRQRNKLFRKALRMLGCLPVKTVHPGFGSSIHYAGTLPYSVNAADYSLHPSGRLHQTTAVYVADSSGFTFLPAKGITLSIMANAHLVAQNAID